MQKDIHYYLTYALAVKAGIDADTAIKIAWANQFTDECVDAGRYGIQTQVKLEPGGNWQDPQIQNTVLVPFHFISGDDPEHPWAVTADSRLAADIVRAAIGSTDPFRIGIALHALQDTFSHQGFTGRREPFNSRYSWDNWMAGIMPNIGHADMGKVPDIANLIWTDPKTFETCNNQHRAVDCAYRTFAWFGIFSGNSASVIAAQWAPIESALYRVFVLKDYNQRKAALFEFGKIEQGFVLLNKSKKVQAWIPGFVVAARKHLATVLESLPTN